MILIPKLKGTLTVQKMFITLGLDSVLLSCLIVLWGKFVFMGSLSTRQTAIREPGSKDGRSRWGTSNAALSGCEMSAGLPVPWSYFPQL